MKKKLAILLLSVSMISGSLSSDKIAIFGYVEC